jgi:hypothetical protein
MVPSEVFKKYSQINLQMNREANEDHPGFDTERPT